MIESSFDAVVEMVRSGPGSHAIRHLLEAAQSATHAPIALLTVRRGHEAQIISTAGSFIVAHDRRIATRARHAPIFGAPQEWADLSIVPGMADLAMVNRPNGWRWFATTPVRFPALHYDVALCCADPRSGVTRRPDLLVRLDHIATAVADALELLNLGLAACQAAKGQDNTLLLPQRSPTGQNADDNLATENSGVTEQFLLSTLVRQHRLLRRNAVGYHALARWRSPLREWQIKALRALKSDPPPSLIDNVGSQIARLSVDMYGRDTYRLVVPVACGNSGPGCLSYELAKDVAAKLGARFAEAFEPITTTGSSHPRRNINRSSMVLRAAPTEALILIDDVATSGAHIEEAVTLLRKSAPAVVPIVWIAG